MIIYFTDSDENIVIGVEANDRTAESIARIVSKTLSYELVEAESEEFDELGDFDQDTIIMYASDFTEEVLELIDKDIKVYLV